ncbi:MetQ/NlpA family ABC transporter substrate-binding protein [Lactobacillus psittaci]|uniref:Lipoprotein n=1 Tax=Lactobacillus psittaci DSM 15354 TaxID=1122152 RepID=A0A0R1S5B2_9LACO|nr:MetQ/NlpA family ABC transporter substrate-binding protein [Lactobacillus psittaci]KRL63694.1 D-methionine-binding lipoprotein MetQ [Lactobacillus psittaci DSM 15354]
MRKKRRKNRIIAAIFVAFLLVAGYFSFIYQGPKESNNTVTIGVVGQTKEDAKIWDSVAATAKKKYGITIKIQNFTDYNQPNKALLNGDIDLNAFQHFAFLEAWNKANKANVISIGKTIIAPIRLYSLKYKSIKTLPAGATIAVPNDASNESRALYVLKNAGLIKLKSGKKIVSVADITSNPKNFQIKEVAADQAGRIIKSVDAAVVNNSYAAPAGLGDKQTIYVEPVNKDSQQWINLIAARSSDKHNKLYLEVVKAYQTKKTKELVKKYYGNTELTGWDIKIK